MAMIGRDLMVGNPRLAELGFGEEVAGPQRHRRRLPGPTPVDRHLSQRRLHGGDPLLVVRLERHPRPVHHGHRKRLPQRRGHALRQPADRHGPGLRRRADLLEPRRDQARDRLRRDRRGGRRADPPDQLRRGRPRRRRLPEDRRPAGHEALLGHHREGSQGVPRRHHLVSGHHRVLPRQRILVALRLARRHAGHACRASI